uniref:Uncharacterized protein n=1 Tax=Panagrellus redivivus TaxID=6233 RepID=A0A7E4UPZ2_PANRE
MSQKYTFTPLFLPLNINVIPVVSQVVQTTSNLLFSIKTSFYHTKVHQQPEKRTCFVSRRTSTSTSYTEGGRFVAADRPTLPTATSHTISKEGARHRWRRILPTHRLTDYIAVPFRHGRKRTPIILKPAVVCPNDCTTILHFAVSKRLSELCELNGLQAAD